MLDISCAATTLCQKYMTLRQWDALMPDTRNIQF